MTREKAAKVHTHQSRRAKPRDVTNRKVAFKGVLDNPFRVLWPSVPSNIQNSILAHLVYLLNGVADFRRSCFLSSKKRNRNPETANGPTHSNAKERGTCGDPTNMDLTTSNNDPLTPQDVAEKPEPPLILKSLTYGINAVTKRLENQIQESRAKLVLKSTSTPGTVDESFDPIRYLFVCRSDVDPPILIDHLPHLVAIYNTLRQRDMPPIILATLPKGAEAILAQSTGVRRLAALAIGDSSTTSKERLAIVDSLLPVTAPWLSVTSAGSYVQTHIKQLRTTAPRDMKMAKEVRLHEKAAIKARRLEPREVAVIP